MTKVDRVPREFWLLFEKDANRLIREQAIIWKKEFVLEMEKTLDSLGIKYETIRVREVLPDEPITRAAIMATDMLDDLGKGFKIPTRRSP